MAEQLIPKVNIASSGLEATITLPRPKLAENEEEVFQGYSYEELEMFVRQAGVVYGIDVTKLQRLVDAPVYDEPVVIAQGTPPGEGTPGSFDLKFDLEVNKKPTIREDGSTDYLNIKIFEVVHKDDVIAVYTPAVQGQPGISVRNTPIDPRPVRDLPPLVGRGFERSEDDLVYTALIDGKIDMPGGKRIDISPVFELSADISVATGNIDFNGDVIIHGGVQPGITIKAGGSISIDGLVEGCDIHAGKDLYLKSGVKGGDKTNISAVGNITAEFIEYASVECGGDIQADVIFKSKVSCDGRIILNGKRSSIVGGNVVAIQGIEVNFLGNDFGTNTSVAVGVTQEHRERLDGMKKKIEAITDNIDKIKKGIEDFDRLGKERGISYANDPRRLQLMRIKIRDEAVVAEERMAMERFERILEGGKYATVKVFDTVFSGVGVTIDMHFVSMSDFQKKVEFSKTPTGVKMTPLLGKIEERK